jgi:hypothetical protein
VNPDRTRELAHRFANDCATTVGDSLRAVLVQREDGNPRTISVAVVVTVLTARMQTDLASLAKRWRRGNVETPLVLSEEDVATSCDVFPLEILMLMDGYELVWGASNPFGGVAIDREHLRLEVEQQLKGKVMHLRQAYLASGGAARTLRALVADSSSGFETIMRGLLFLAGQDHRKVASELAMDLERALEIPLTSFRSVLAARAQGKAPDGDAEAIFRSYLDELAALARAADRITRA